MLTGEKPFRGSVRMLLHQVVYDPPPSPRKLNGQIPKDLETICLKAIDKDPDRRYQTSSEFASDLRCFLQHKPISARPLSPIQLGYRWCRRNPRVAFLAFLCTATLIAGTVVSAYYGYQADKSRDEVTKHLYSSLMNTIDATHAARSMGYRERIRDLVDDATNLPRDVVDYEEIRLKYIAAMGDFVGYSPTDIIIPVGIFSLSQTGKYAAATVKKDMVAIFDVASGLSIQELHFPDEQIKCLEFSDSRDHLSIVFASGKCTFWQLDGNSWKEVNNYSINAEIKRCTLSTDNQTFAAFTGSEIKVWKNPHKETETRLSVEGFDIIGLAFSPNLTLLAATVYSSAKDSYGLVVWNLNNGAIIHQQYYDYGSTYPNGIDFSPDSGTLCLGFEDTLLVLETEHFQQVMNQRVDAIKAVRVSPGGETLATVDTRGSVHLWALQSQRLIAQLRHPRRFASNARICFSGDGKQLSTSNSDGIRSWRLDKTEERIETIGHRGSVNCALFVNKPTECLVTGGRDSILNWWDASSGSLIHQTDLPGPVQSLALSRKKDLIAAAFWGPNHLGVTVYDVESKKQLLQFEHSVVAACSIAFLDSQELSNELLAISGLEGISIMGLHRSTGSDGELVAEELMHEKGNRCLHVAGSSDDKFLLWVEDDNKIVVWDRKENRRINYSGPKMNQGWHGLAVFQIEMRWSM